MNWEAILSGAGGAGIIAVVLKLIDVYSTRSKMKSDAADTVVDTMLEAMKYLREERIELREERNEYLGRIEILEQNQNNNITQIQELQKHSDERNKQIELLTESNEDLDERNDALTAQVAGLRAQIAKDTAETRQLREDFKIYKDEVKKYFAELIQFLQSRGVEDYPQPPDNLLDTDPNIDKKLKKHR